MDALQWTSVGITVIFRKRCEKCIRELGVVMEAREKRLDDLGVFRVRAMADELKRLGHAR